MSSVEASFGRALVTAVRTAEIGREQREMIAKPTRYDADGQSCLAVASFTDPFRVLRVRSALWRCNGLGSFGVPPWLAQAPSFSVASMYSGTLPAAAFCDELTYVTRYVWPPCAVQ